VDRPSGRALGIAIEAKETVVRSSWFDPLCSVNSTDAERRYVVIGSVACGHCEPAAKPAPALVRRAWLDETAVRDRRGQGGLSSLRQGVASRCGRNSSGVRGDRERLSRRHGLLPALWADARVLRLAIDSKAAAGPSKLSCAERSPSKLTWEQSASGRAAVIVCPIFGWHDDDSLEVDHPWPLEIKAEGYADQSERLGTLTKRWRDRNGADPPPMVIRLKRQAARP